MTVNQINPKKTVKVFINPEAQAVAAELPEDIYQIVKQAVHFTFENERPKAEYRISVMLISDNEIIEMNKRYLNKDNPTDILCFPYSGGNDVQAEMFISVDTAKLQAGDYGHTFLEELLFIAIHGILHMVGYHDDTQEQRQGMWDRQEQLLKASKCI
ncbi:MAG: rRNA maturation RNase YbeY [Elusimicrobia bacterium RIFOXYA2_FULL_39_19]|nr:MAG: rRNA maturation RNase YbeY [Elusimicrobia bacterium RIFOXYA2_FULL_39_19]